MTLYLLPALKSIIKTNNQHREKHLRGGTAGYLAVLNFHQYQARRLRPEIGRRPQQTFAKECVRYCMANGEHQSLSISPHAERSPVISENDSEEAVESLNHEATELSSVHSPSSQHISTRHSDISTAADSHTGSAVFRIRSSESGSLRNAGTLRRWWRRHVSVRVPHEACRDHLGTRSRSCRHLLAMKTLSAFDLC